ncbi:MAG: dihydrolipoamide acetyltransferase [Myxococcota bacterium]
MACPLWAWAQGQPAPAAAPSEPAPAAAPAAPAAPPAEAAPPTSPAPAPAEGTPAPAPGADTGLKTADEAYELKIKTLEERVNELKERIFRSKQRLAQLQEAVVGGVTSGAKARIIHRNEMGASFKLREIHYFLDGAPLRQELDETGDGLAKKDEFDLFDGSILPGNHQITVNLVYQGSGYGVFSYLDGYQFKIRSSHTFTAEEGKEVVIKVVAYEQGNVTTEMKDRPTVRYDMEVRALQKPKTDGAGAAPSGAGAGGGGAK